MTTGIEYNITPSGADSPIYTGGGPNQWANTPIGVPIPNPLNNFRVGVRYYEERATTTNAFLKHESTGALFVNNSGLSKIRLQLGSPISDPDPDNPGDPTNRVYPGFELISQTLECIDPSNGDVFVSGVDYPLVPTFTAPLETYAADLYATAGITDGAAYAYAKVFDQTEFRLIPATFVLSDDPPDIEVNNIPLEPYDPDNNIFPYKSITAYNPDVRDAVLVTYRLTTTVEGRQIPIPGLTPGSTMLTAGLRVTDTINITQWVTQSINDWGPACRYYVCRGQYSSTKSDLNYCPVVPWEGP
jgi:hypothetical protein